MRRIGRDGEPIVLKIHPSAAPASGKAAHPAGPGLAFTGVFTPNLTPNLTPDADDADPQPPSRPNLFPQSLFDDGGGLDLQASMLGNAAMSFMLTDAPDLTMNLPMAAAAAAAVGPRTSANDALALKANLARSRLGVSGAGIRIGIMSNSFNLLGGYARDVANGDLPGGVRILKEGPAGGTDEGRAMADLVHQVAPGASIYFYTATSGEADFANGIQALQQAGCQVIVDDVTYLDEPFFQDGSVLQQAVEKAVAQGVNYFTSASNEGHNFFQAAWTPVSTRLPGLPGTFRTQNFGTAQSPSSFMTLSVPVNGTFSVDLQWDQPFASIGNSSGAANSLGLALYTADGRLVGTAAGLQVKHNAEQLLQFTNRTSGTSFKLVVFANGLAAPSLLKFIVYGNATLGGPGIGVGSGTVTGHELVAGANTVGAINYSATPAFGGGGAVEGFSSAGSGEILFDSAGHRLSSPLDAGKVSFVAPDGGVTSVLAPFFGTSAAAPNAAAVAALMLQADPSLSPAQVSNILARSATPVTAGPGAGGAGLIQADVAVQMALAMVGHS